MNLFGVMSLSGQGLTVQRQRAEVSAANMANAETTRTEAGTPYQRHQVVLQSGDAAIGFTRAFHSAGNDAASGVSIAEVVESNAPPVLRYDPSHPDANTEGYVAYPNINPLSEMVDLMGASRAYGLNASALQAEKGMLTASLDLLK